MQTHTIPGPMPVPDQLTADVLTMVRAGAMDAPETFRAAVRHLARLRRLTVRQARDLFRRIA